jgi:prevent-host-death family protein
MIVNIHAAKTNLSKLIQAAEAGEEVIVARNGKPAVRLTPVGPIFAKREKGAWLGSLEGRIWIAPGSEEPDMELAKIMEDGPIFPPDDEG